MNQPHPNPKPPHQYWIELAIQDWNPIQSEWKMFAQEEFQRFKNAAQPEINEMDVSAHLRGTKNGRAAIRKIMKMDDEILQLREQNTKLRELLLKTNGKLHAANCPALQAWDIPGICTCN